MGDAGRWLGSTRMCAFVGSADVVLSRTSERWPPCGRRGWSAAHQNMGGCAHGRHKPLVGLVRTCGFGGSADVVLPRTSELRPRVGDAAWSAHVRTCGAARVGTRARSWARLGGRRGRGKCVGWGTARRT